jgi:hypothetical protein
MRRAAAATLLVLLAACGGSQAPLAHLVLPGGYQAGLLEPGEPAAFRRQYRADAGASAVALHRVDAPGGGPSIVVVALAWPRSMDHDLAALAHRLEHDVPIAGSVPAAIGGHPARVHAADATFQSVVLAVDGHRGVVVYGGMLADERALAGAALRSW